MKYLRTLLIATVFISMALSGPQVEAVTFSINFDSSFDTQAKKDALQFAANEWGALLVNNYVGETITINAKFDSTLAGTSAISSTTPLGAVYDSSLSPFFFYPVALANHLKGSDMNGGTSEINMSFNPSIVETINQIQIPIPWYFGTDGNTTSGSMDFVTNALHEITHGLGMVSGMNGDGSLMFTVPGQFYTGYIYDAFVYDTGISLYPIGMNQTNRATSLTSGNLVFNGVSAINANGGVPPELYAPNPFKIGSSVVHLDPLDIPGDLMGPFLSPGVSRTPSAIDIGILKGVGWNFEEQVQPVPEPCTLFLLGSGLLGLLGLRKKFKS
jgi:hypothetical protein